jgi:hypothetical protein
MNSVKDAARAAAAAPLIGTRLGSQQGVFIIYVMRHNNEFIFIFKLFKSHKYQFFFL